LIIRNLVRRAAPRRQYQPWPPPKQARRGFVFLDMEKAGR